MECPIEETGRDRRASDRWRVNKEISVVDLVTIFSALAMIVAMYFTLDKRLLVVETTFSSQRTIDARLAQERDFTRQQTREVRDELRQDLAGIHAKLEKMNTLLLQQLVEDRKERASHGR